MATALFRNRLASTARRVGASNAVKTAALASTSFVRGKATLPDLPCKLNATKLDRMVLKAQFSK